MLSYTTRAKVEKLKSAQYGSIDGQFRKQDSCVWCREKGNGGGWRQRALVGCNFWPESERTAGEGLVRPVERKWLSSLLVVIDLGGEIRELLGLARSYFPSC